MKTCSMCGTLLFDDVEKCTKCGQVLIEKEGGTTEQEAVGAEAPEHEVQEEPSTEVPEEKETTAKGKNKGKDDEGPSDTSEETVSETPEQTEATEPIDGKKVVESSEKRKKWLDEQEKIKAELSNIMGRIGKKKTPPSQPGRGPGLASPSAVNPLPTPVPPGTAPLQPQTYGPSTPTIPTAPALTDESENGEEGLSDFDKNELMGELDDLRNEGYIVSRLERIIEENPKTAWKSFSEFLDDIEKLNQQKARLERINTKGFDTFESRKNEIYQKMNDPDNLAEYESEITKLENDFLATKSEAEKQAALEAIKAEEKKDEQLKQLIDVGKEAFKVKDYEKALDIFSQASAMAPNNREIVFFKKKIEAKLLEALEGPAPEQADGIPGQKKKKKKKKKKIVARKSIPGAPVPAGAPQPAQVPYGVDVPSQGEPMQPQQVAIPQPIPQQPVQVKPQHVTPVQPQQVTPQPQPVAAASQAPQDADVDDGPRSAAEFEALGFNAYINKDYPKALEFYEKVLEIDPNFPGVESIRNECLMRLGKK